MSQPRGSLLERHGRRMARLRWAVIPVWILIIAGAVMLTGRLGEVTTNDLSLPDSEAQRGTELIQAHFSSGREYSDVQPVFRHPRLTVDEAAYRAAAMASLARTARVVPGKRLLLLDRQPRPGRA
jgi:uncharacterized membrane protein YdfJ with MMPL/SSD domain